MTGAAAGRHSSVYFPVDKFPPSTEYTYCLLLGPRKMASHAQRDPIALHGRTAPPLHSFHIVAPASIKDNLRRIVCGNSALRWSRAIIVIIVRSASELNIHALALETRHSRWHLHGQSGGIIYGRVLLCVCDGRGRHIKELNHMFGWSLI